MSLSSFSPIAAKEWTPEKARHLLNRAGFGLPYSRIESLAKLSPERAVAQFVDYESVPDPFDPPNFLVDPQSREQLRQMSASMTVEDRRRAQVAYNQSERQAIQTLKAWWLWRMQSTKRPLMEKLALFWHGHFATSAQKVRSSWHTYQLNDVFRQNATGNFKSLTIAVGQSPSMLRYLDNMQSTKKSPNENWARELMELFTMGKGTYSEADIKNSARAFTGWSADHLKFDYREQTHDFGTKTFLGKTGDFDGWDILNIIFEQPVTAEHISSKLWKYFANEQPDETTVKTLADTLRANNYELKPVLRQMFLSNAFYTPEVMGAQIKSPVQFALQLGADFDLPSPPYGLMARMTARLGQDLFLPPNVKGWEGNRAWVNANNLLIRYNAPIMLARTKAETGANANKNDMQMQTMQTMQMQTMQTTQMKPDLADVGKGKKGMAPRERAKEIIERLPESERLDARERLMAAKPEERRQILEALAKETAVSGPWNARSLLAGLRFATAGECVDALAARYLVAPLSSQQKAVLIESLGAKDETDALKADAIVDARLTSTLHLLFSTAEYQLC